MTWKEWLESEYINTVSDPDFSTGTGFQYSSSDDYMFWGPGPCYYILGLDNKKIKAVKIFEVKDLYNYIDGLDTILIDEYQFICASNEIDNFMDFLEYCDVKNIDVYLFGLQLDYMCRSFDVTQRVLPYADSVIVLSARCDYCGEKASRCL